MKFVCVALYIGLDSRLLQLQAGCIVLCLYVCMLLLDAFDLAELRFFRLSFRFRLLLLYLLIGGEIFSMCCILFAEFSDNTLEFATIFSSGWLTHRCLTVCRRGARLGRSAG